MQNGSGDGNPKKWGQFTSLADPPGGCHFSFVKVVVDVVSRGIVQGNYCRNELFRSLESAKGLNQSLAINSVEGLFEVEAKYCSTDAKFVLSAGFNPCAQCESTRGRFSNDVFILAHPGMDSCKRICDVSLRKIGKLWHPRKLGPNMLEEAISNDGRKGFRFRAHQADRSESSRIGWRFPWLREPHYPRIRPLFREDGVGSSVLFKGFLKQGRNKVSTNAPGCGWCNPWGDRLANLGDAQFMLHLFKGEN